jgi:L-methionine (R)-S-oxide reductase
MHHAESIATADKPVFHRELAAQVRALIEGERDPIANTANVAALLALQMPALNWAGFYFLKTPGELVLGPFQGKPACIRIPAGKGVCGTAAAERRSIRVADVEAFPGHIACDAASRSELVTPILLDGRVLGVIDLDSPEPGRFDADDEAGLVVIADLLALGCDWENERG